TVVSPARADDDVAVFVAPQFEARPVSASVLDATGYVVARRAATVSTKTTGKVAAILVEEGMAVKEGQVIARLDDTLTMAGLRLAQAQVDIAEATGRELDAEIRRVRLDLERWRALVATRMANEAQLDRLEAELGTLLARQRRAQKAVVVAERQVELMQIRVDDLRIQAPFSGVVVKKSAQPGEVVSPISAGGGFTRTGICTIVDMASLEVEVDVDESYINRVLPSQPVEIRLNAYPEKLFGGRVIAVIPTADRSKATMRVRIRFLSSDHRVLPEMGVRVAFLAALTTPAEEDVES
ncbi:MAG: efflux RND transporter periplasmic adaptor subunit, partial [Pseudomonadota bacterium]